MDGAPDLLVEQDLAGELLDSEMGTEGKFAQ